MGTTCCVTHGVYSVWGSKDRLFGMGQQRPNTGSGRISEHRCFATTILEATSSYFLSQLSRARDGRTTKNQRYILAAVEERDPYCRVHTSTPRVYRLFIITLHKVCGLSQRHYRSPVPNRLEEELTSDYRQSRLTSVLSDMTSSRSRGLLK